MGPQECSFYHHIWWAMAATYIRAYIGAYIVVMAMAPMAKATAIVAMVIMAIVAMTTDVGKNMDHRSAHFQNDLGPHTGLSDRQVQ